MNNCFTVNLTLTRSHSGTSILVPGSLFSFAGDEYTRPSLFVAQRAQSQLECKANYIHMKWLVRVSSRAHINWDELLCPLAYNKTTLSLPGMSILVLGKAEKKIHGRI